MEIRPFDSKGTEWLFQWEELKRINTLSAAEERKKTPDFLSWCFNRSEREAEVL